MLIKRKEREAHRSSLAGALVGQADGGLDRRTFLRRSGLVAGGLASLGALSLGSVRKAQAGPPPTAGARVIATQEHLHALLGRLHGRRRGREWGVDRPGAGMGKPDQSRVALRQGRLGARTRARRPSPQISDEARQRTVDPHQLGPGHQRNRRQADGHPHEVRAGFASLAGLGEMSNEGAYLFRKFAAFWGTNNSDHQARICHSTTVTGVANTWGYGAMTNSYNDIRNSKTMIIMGRQSRRGASGVAAASARRRGAQPRQFHRRRSAPDAHRRARDRIRPHPAGHRHPGRLRHDVARFSERLGGQGIHCATRLRH